jgi:RecA-family ATPase
MKALPSSPQSLPVVRAAELKQTLPDTRWLIESLWAEGGVGLIGGTPKSLKSWLGLEMAVSVATGTACLGRFPVRSPGPALVYLAEDAPTVVRERLLALCLVRSIALDNLDVRVITAPSLRIDLKTEQEKLKETIALHRPRLLVLDPFVRLHRIDENQAQEVAPLLDFLRTLNRTYEIAIVLVHHTRKSGSGSQSGQALRGSSDFHAWGCVEHHTTPFVWSRS